MTLWVIYIFKDIYFESLKAGRIQIYLTILLKFLFLILKYFIKKDKRLQDDSRWNSLWFCKVTFWNSHPPKFTYTWHQSMNPINIEKSYQSNSILSFPKYTVNFLWLSFTVFLGIFIDCQSSVQLKEILNFHTVSKSLRKRKFSITKNVPPKFECTTR